MSHFASEAASSHDRQSLHLNDHSCEGQRHDRIQIDQRNTKAMAASGSPDITLTQRMISATVGSIFTSLLVTPLDVVRVRLQSQSPNPVADISRFSAYTTSFKQLPPDLGVTACCREVFFVGDNAQFCIAGGNGSITAATVAEDCAAEEAQRKTFNSTFDGLKKIARNEGTLSLWRGLSPTLLMAIPGNVIYFTGYDWMRYNAASPIRYITNDTYAPLFAGSIARVAAAVVVSPIEMFRTRMQATPGSSTGIFRETLFGLHRMTQTQGYSSLWRGLTLTMWRDVPFSGIYWWGYEVARNQLADARRIVRGQTFDSDRLISATRYTQTDENHTTTFVDSFLAGAVSGGIAAFFTTPFDVGKTRQQVFRYAGDEAIAAAAAAAKTSLPTSSKAATAASLVPEQLSMPRFLYHIFTNEGPAGLFRGWAARCLKISPACAIMISSYEVGKKWAKGVNERQRQEQEVEPV